MSSNILKRFRDRIASGSLRDGSKQLGEAEFRLLKLMRPNANDSPAQLSESSRNNSVALSVSENFRIPIF